MSQEKCKRNKRVPSPRNGDCKTALQCYDKCAESVNITVSNVFYNELSNCEFRPTEI